MKIILLVIAVIWCSSNPYSQEKGIITCDSAQTQFELTQCAREKSKRADKDLYELEEQLLNKIRTWKEGAKEDGDQKAVKHYTELENVFIESRKSWVNYRDSYCKFFESVYGGSMMPMQVYIWRSRLTLERVEALKSLQKEYK